MNKNIKRIKDSKSYEKTEDIRQKNQYITILTSERCHTL